MKLQNTYFGNRFAAVARKSQTAKAARNSRRVAVTEMEALESRILLSGIGTGLNKRSVNFFDADGDKVTVNIQAAAGARNVSFNIDLGGATNNADAANISINGNGSLGVVVTPVGSFTKPIIAGKPAVLDPGGLVIIAPQPAQWSLTPGYTNIGSITVGADSKGVVPTAIGSIGLNAAVVGEIDLAGVTVGNINLSTGRVAAVDQIMGLNVDPAGVKTWTAGLGNIDLWDVTAKSIGGINISGSPVAGTNDFEGNITVETGIARITGTNSAFKGMITLTGPAATLGNIVLGNGWANSASIDAAGDLTFNASGFTGILNVDGHLNLAIQGAGAFTGTIIAGKGVSGLRAATTDAIFVTGNAANGGEILSGLDIADIIVNNASGFNNATIKAVGTIGDITIADGTNFKATTIEGAKIGTITSLSNGIGGAVGGVSILSTGDLEGIVIRNADLVNPFAVNANLISVGGELGLVDIANGDLNGIISAGDVGNVTVRGGGITAAGSVVSGDGIGAVLVDGGTLAGNLIAKGAAGIVSVTVNDYAGLNAIDGATIDSAGTIGSITAYSVNGAAITDASILSDVDITSVSATSVTGNAISDATDQVLISAVGTIGAITASSATGNALDGTAGNLISVIGGSLGPITATSVTGVGINGFVAPAAINIDFKATSAAGTGIASLTASGNAGAINGLTLNSANGIGPIVATGTVSNFELTTTKGDIGDISATATGGDDALKGLVLNATAGNIGNITGVAENGVGILGVNATAFGKIGTISGTSVTGDGISGGAFKAITGDITAVTAITSTGVGISGKANFEATGGKILAISSTPTGAGGRAIDTANFEATSIGDLTFAVTNVAGGDVLNNATFTATAGDIGKITVTNASTDAKAGQGIIGASTFTATGNIGNISVTTVSNGIAGAAVFTADSDGDLLGDIGTIAVTATGAGADAINGAAFNAQNIGAITANSTHVASGDAIDTTNFKANGNIGAVTASSGAGWALTGVNLTADADASKAGDLSTITATSAKGGAIFGGAFTGANVGNILATVTGATSAKNGIDSLVVTANEGTIGTLTVNYAGTANAVDNSDFTADDGIGAISVTSAADGIMNGSNFAADFDADNTGNIASITVTSSGAGAVGIGDATSSFNAAEIGDIAVTLSNTLGAGIGIDGALFTATTKVTAGVGQFNNTGKIGNILVSNASADGAAVGIQDAKFNAGAAGSIGNIQVDVVGGTAILNSVNDVEFKAVNLTGTDVEIDSTIGTVTVTATQGAGINGAQFQSNDGIGAFTATTFANGINAANVDVDLDGDGVGTVAGITVTVTGKNATGILNSTFDGAAIGNIQVDLDAVTGAGDAMDNADFTAVTNTETAVGSGKFNNLGTIGTITVTNDSTDTNADGITNGSDFKAGAGGAGIGAISVTTAGGDGIIGGSDFLANNLSKGGGDTLFEGSIASLTVTAADEGINNSDFTAAKTIGAIVVTAGETGISGGSDFLADSNGDNAGEITSLKVTVTGAGFDGINGSTFQGAAIGNIQVDLDAVTGAGVAMDDADFTAVTNTETAVGSGKFNNLGTIGTITVTNDSTDTAADGITNDSDFNAGAGGAGIGAISVTTKGGDGITGGSDFLANNLSAGGADTLFEGSIASLTVTAADEGINNSDFTAAKTIGAIVVTAGETGISAGADFLADSNADNVGEITSLKVTVTEAGFDGINTSTFQGAAIGNIQVDLDAVTGVGDAMNNTDFTAVTNTETAAGSGLFNNLGTIGTITVTNDSTAAGAEGIIGGSDFKAGAGGSIGAVTVTTKGGAAFDGATLDATTTSVGGGDTKLDSTVGAITVAAGTGTGIVVLNVNSLASIGAITSAATGDANQALTLDSKAIGAITLNQLADTKTVTLNVGATATTLGALDIGAATAGKTANLTLVGGAALTTLGAITVEGNAVLPNLAAATSIGNITVGGNLTLAGAAALTTLGNVNIGGIATLPNLGAVTTAGTIDAGNIAGGNTMGAGAPGSKIGLVTVGTGVGNAYTFNFAEMNGKTNAAADGTLAVDFLDATVDITTLAAKAPGATSGGITAILV
jgi:hypothetical protein